MVYKIPTEMNIYLYSQNTPVNGVKYLKIEDLKAQFINEELYKHNSYVTNDAHSVFFFAQI